MSKKRKKAAKVLFMFALLLVVGAIYALLTGVLTFSGTVFFRSGDLYIENAVNPNNTAKGSSGTIEVDQTTRKSAIINADLVDPDETLDFRFQLQNTYSAPIRITNISSSALAPLSVSGTSLGLIIAPNSSSTQQSLTVRWVDDNNPAPNNRPFEFTLSYESLE